MRKPESDSVFWPILYIILFLAFVSFAILYPSIKESNRYDDACAKIGGTPAHAEGFRGCFAPGVLLNVPSK